MRFLNLIERDPWGAALYVARVLFLLVVGVVVLGSVFGCATTVRSDGINPDGSMTYTLTPEQVAQCEMEGGCSTVTDAYEKQLVREAAKHFCGVDI